MLKMGLAPNLIASPPAISIFSHSLSMKSAPSLQEGEKRPVYDIELNALADILNASVDRFLSRDE